MPLVQLWWYRAFCFWWWYVSKIRPFHHSKAITICFTIAPDERLQQEQAVWKLDVQVGTLRIPKNFQGLQEGTKAKKHARLPTGRTVRLELWTRKRQSTFLFEFMWGTCRGSFIESRGIPRVSRDPCIGILQGPRLNVFFCSLAPRLVVREPAM